MGVNSVIVKVISVNDFAWAITVGVSFNNSSHVLEKCKKWDITTIAHTCLKKLIDHQDGLVEYYFD